MGSMAVDMACVGSVAGCCVLCRIVLFAGVFSVLLFFFGVLVRWSVVRLVVLILQFLHVDYQFLDQLCEGWSFCKSKFFFPAISSRGLIEIDASGT